MFPGRRGMEGAYVRHLQMIEMRFCNQDVALLPGVYGAVLRN